MDDFFKKLYDSIEELYTQEYATHTVHQVLFRLKDVFPVSSAALILKNDKTDYLEINNRYNISEQFTKSFKRGIGKRVVGRIFFKDDYEVVTRDRSKDDYDDLYLESDYHTAVAIRINLENCPSGFLAIYFDQAYQIGEREKEFLLAMARVCAEAIRKERLSVMTTELRRLDPETGLLTCNYFHQKLREEFEKCHRYDIPMTLAIMDIDNYKDILDLYGTEIGSSLYREVSEELKGCTRGIDLLGRCGADEFMVCLPNTPIENAQIVIDRFVDALKAKRFTAEGLSTSVSIGMACYRSNCARSDMVKNAQVAIYHARLAGKGIVRVCNE